MTASEEEQNLNYLKLHPRFPFAEYLTNEMDLLCLELYWVYLFKSTVAGNAQGAWRAFMPPDVSRGGDLIFSAIHSELKRAVKVIHNRPEAHQKHYSDGGTYYPFQPYLTVAQPESDIYESQLSLIADLSPESEKWSRLFIGAFCVDRVPYEKIEELIASYEEQVNMPSVEDVL